MILALASGALFGWLLPEWSQQLAVISNIFLQLIKSIIAPVLFAVKIFSISREMVSGSAFAVDTGSAIPAPGWAHRKANHPINNAKEETTSK